MISAEPLLPTPSPEEVEEALIATREHAASQKLAATLDDVIALFGHTAIEWNADGTKWRVKLTSEKWSVETNRKRFNQWSELTRPHRRNVIERSEQRDAVRPKIKAVNTRTGEQREIPAELENLVAKRGGWRPKSSVGQLLDSSGRPYR